MTKALPTSAGDLYQLDHDLQLDSCDQIATNDANRLEVVVRELMTQARGGESFGDIEPHIKKPPLLIYDETKSLGFPLYQALYQKSVNVPAAIERKMAYRRAHWPKLTTNWNCYASTSNKPKEADGPAS